LRLKQEEHTLNSTIHRVKFHYSSLLSFGTYFDIVHTCKLRADYL